MKVNWNQFDWEDIGLKLAAYSHKKARRFNRMRGGSKDLPGGKSPKDLAYEAIKLVWGYERKWNRKRYPNIQHFLESVVDCLYSHLGERAENVYMNNEAIIPTPSDPYALYRAEHRARLSEHSDPASNAEALERLSLLLEKTEELRGSSKELVHDLCVTQIKFPEASVKELAKILKRTPKQVYSARSSLRQIYYEFVYPAKAPVDPVDPVD